MFNPEEDWEDEKKPISIFILRNILLNLMVTKLTTV